MISFSLKGFVVVAALIGLADLHIENLLLMIQQKFETMSWHC